MASSRDTRNGPDVVDVLGVMIAFEELNSVRLTVALNTQASTRASFLQVTMKAYEKSSASTDQKPLASHQLTIGYGNGQTMEAAILQGLYKLDGMLAEAEFAKVKSQKA